MNNNIQDFITRWTEAEGNEQREANSFWIELCGILGITQPTRVLDFEKKVHGRRIDVFYESMRILIENKSRGVDLDKKYKRGNTEGGKDRFVTPYEQAKWYADNLVDSIRPRWLIVCNFDVIRIHDLDKEYPATEYIELHLEDLERGLHVLGFFTDKSKDHLRIEKNLSVDAANLVGKLYEQLFCQYKNIENDPHEQRSLNVLIVRLVFLLYAEDADLLQEKDAVLDYLREFPADQMRQALINLFAVLDTPPEQRDPYISDSLNAFPYVNGGLFGNDDIVIPQFNEQIRIDLLLEASMNFDWSRISPTIFGAAFESTLNPDTRRTGGMHYTSPENIHKVIDPLFLDALRAELSEIEGEASVGTRRSRLRQFQQKLASIRVFDPAAGSGNFLTESYLSLRRLENRVLENLQDNQQSLGFGDAKSEFNPICVHIDQFFGIEINDFAVSVAKTALWIAENQMMKATQKNVDMPLTQLPLTSNNNIHTGNALRMDWNDVLPASQCTYIIGNPPFVGARNQTKEQKAEIVDAFHGAKNCGNIDYVAGWYAKAAEYMKCAGETAETADELLNAKAKDGNSEGVFGARFQASPHTPSELPLGYGGSETSPSRVSADSSYTQSQSESGEGELLKAQAKDGALEGVHGAQFQESPRTPSNTLEDNVDNSFSPSRIHAAFVSTNSICQGEQVANVWKPLFEQGIRINFAHNTFRWKNESNAADQAHVFCVIVGFSYDASTPKKLFIHKTPDDETGEVTEPENINAYLIDAPNAFIFNVSKPLCETPAMGIGSQPIDGGNYLFKPDEMEEFLKAEPAAEKFFHPWIGSDELMKGRKRYVLWLGEVLPSELKQLPLCRQRIQNVMEFRKKSKRKQTLKAAETPQHFGTEIIAETTSIIVPRVSSERRKYAPIGFITPDIFASDSALLIPNATLYHFGILHSQVHNAWMRVVCGRLKSDYRYSAGVVYNNFPWPGVTADTLGVPVEECVSAEVRENIEQCAQEVLDAREFYVNQAEQVALKQQMSAGGAGGANTQDNVDKRASKSKSAKPSRMGKPTKTSPQRAACSLADLYDPDNAFLYPRLTRAHEQLDTAVESAYNVRFNGNEEQIVAHLFKLYAQLTSK